MATPLASELGVMPMNRVGRARERGAAAPSRFRVR